MRLPISILFLAISVPALAQAHELFEVSNPKHMQFNSEEAMKSYLQSVSEVEAEYHLLQHLTPKFALVLGVDRNSLVWPNYKTSQGAEIRLTRWEPRIFRQGVIALSINELLRPENVTRLELHIESIEEAVVDVRSLRK